MSVPQVPNLGQVPRLPRGAVAKQLPSWEHETLLVVLRTMDLASCPVLGQCCASERAAQLNRAWAVKAGRDTITEIGLLGYITTC